MIILKKISAIILVLGVFAILLFILNKDNIELRKQVDKLHHMGDSLNKANESLKIGLVLNATARQKLSTQVEDEKEKNKDLQKKIANKELQFSLLRKKYVGLTSNTLRKLLISKYDTVIVKPEETISIPKEVAEQSISKYDEVDTLKSIITVKDLLIDGKDRIIALKDSSIFSYRADSVSYCKIINNDKAIITIKDNEITGKDKIIKKQKRIIFTETVIGIGLIIISIL